MTRDERRRVIARRATHLRREYERMVGRAHVVVEVAARAPQRRAYVGDDDRRQTLNEKKRMRARRRREAYRAALR